jgi:Skp family chaperone for outer membrane proteins
MNRKNLGLFLLATCVSSLMAAGVTLLALHLSSPQTVQAAPPHDELRIAIVNLERVSRSTPRFRKLKVEWDAVQLEFDEQNEADEAEYRLLVAEIAKARLADPDDPQIELRSMAQAQEEMIKAARKEQEEYLAALLAEFQRIVLLEVMENVRRHSRQQGFRLVLQDYDDVSGEDADFFSGSGFAQSLMSKPVLDAPYALEGDKHVTDITDVMIKFMRDGGVPEKKD